MTQKLSVLSQGDKPSQWAAELSREWMRSNPEETAYLYIDGHVRVYNGHLTNLPKHYVARQKLCLRATTDYWVNGMDGQPFFVINQEVDPGLIKALEAEIVPRLEKDVPSQPSKEELEQDPLLSRFTLVFDREGYSPALFLKMKKKRIACLTYRKNPGEEWAESEFSPRQIQVASGGIVEMALGERGTRLSNGLWVREIRKLTPRGHQTSILSTDYKSDMDILAPAMFARWSQENFFKYMRLHYGLDRIVQYSTEPIPDTTKVVNPVHRKLDGSVRKQVAILTRLEAKFGALILKGQLDSKKVGDYERKKAELKEEIDHLSREVKQLKEKRKETPKHITIEQLPEEERFNRLSQQSKYFMDTIKMIAYRAETAMANSLQEKMSHPGEARSLLMGIYNCEVDILPDPNQGTLTIKIHPLANRMTSEAVAFLCEELNSTKTKFPGTDLVLKYELTYNEAEKVKANGGRDN